MTRHLPFLLMLVVLPAFADPSADRPSAMSYTDYVYRNPGPVAIAGYRPPSPALDAKTASRLNLQNANPYDFYLPCYYGGWCFYGFYQTPYGLIESSGSLPW